jgi:hypothetical protein
VEGHERDHIPTGRTRHRLDSGAEWGKLTSLDEVKQLLVGHIGPRPVRHRGGKVSGGLVA